MLKRLVLCLFMMTVIGFVALTFTLIPQLGTGPLLAMGKINCGSSRAWGVGLAVVMGLCALAGVVSFLLYCFRSRGRGDFC